MGKIGDLFKFLRDGIALIFTWLVICSAVVARMAGTDRISIRFLAGLFVLSFWAVISFGISFRLPAIRKKGFILSLTLFYLLFLPVEITLFYRMGIFRAGGTGAEWLIFGGILLLAYLSSLIIDLAVMRRRAVLYTEKMMRYIAGNSGPKDGADFNA
ncbi:MAG: hypothetical protein K6E81_02980 [Lachnospiraceae bacterium]|nr:hypothetical protein [Lachnospiraceae bacterium]